MAEIIIRNMPRELRQELKVQAAREGRSMTAIIIRLIIDYLQMKRKEGGRYDKDGTLYNP
jgi:plasmid stability protein